MMTEGRKSYRHYIFSADATLNDHQCDHLIASFQKPSHFSDAPLGGRRLMPAIMLAPFGAVVVKCYRRGGLMARFNRRHYLTGGTTRSEREFQWLKRVRTIGIKAPEPVVAVRRGRLAYRCWLVTRKVNDATSLAQLSFERPNEVKRALAECARQIDILVENRILHPDLHPGNVLVDTDGRPWLIDFDKTAYYRGRRQRLAARYRQRWQRAVRKHRLPAGLDALMALGPKGRLN
jgi:3-deoxy-D-manno-octulosonic acid kinase